ncbi:DUF4157 domain-containing protein [Fulvivirga sp. 29W222]|uniref:DUF4157 domain-containing protein n=1 Tax=Fulvivirga marina TaxID=2494733 RepID=A0A937G2J1_9BACT|nr:DUF4157 domain-containing protein [Fulvivirga marina]MBL6448800.1 DUF4157 domain-containing protein [Fulvivirga marina]
MQDNLLQNQQQSATTAGRKNSNLDKDNLFPDSKVFNTSGKAGFKRASTSLMNTLGEGAAATIGINAPAQMKAINMPTQLMVDKGVKEDEKVQMKSGGDQSTGGNPASQSGALPSSVLSKMEGAFNTSFSDVKVHNNSSSATSMGALAYAQGSSIHFAPGQYNPNSTKGQELIGHELTHVVQQRQGRVKATTQAKGAPVNDDPTLEREADEMGKKAVQGKFADVKGSSGNAVQMQEDPKKEDITYYNGWGAKETISGVEVKGDYYNVQYVNGEPRKANVAKIIKTTKSKWKEILKNADRGYHMYHKWIFGFLKANVHGLREFKWIPNQAVISASNSGPLYCDLYDNSPYGEQDILNFMEALYGIGENENETDLPNGYNLEGGVFAERTFFPMMGQFVAKHQPTLLRSVSYSGNNRLDSSSGNIRHFADEATPQGVFSYGSPDVIINMIQSAYGSALASVKAILNMSVNGINDTNVTSAMNENNVVYNAGLTINNAIKAYEGVVNRVNENRQSAFDLAWSLVPFSDKVPDIAKESLKMVASAGYKAVFSSKADNVSDLKDKMKSEFSGIQGFINDIINDPEVREKVNFDLLGLRIDNLKNTFDAGIDG